MPVNEFGQRIGDPVDAGRFPRPTPPRSPIEGRLCRIVPMDRVYYDALHIMFGGAHRPHDGAAEAGDQPVDWTYLPYGPFTNTADFTRWASATCEGDDPLFHVILDASGLPMGIASYLRIDPQAGSLEVGHIHLSKMIQRKPVATEAMFLMMRRAFDELGYRRYEWKCDALNERSRAAALRLGFTYEGTFRQATHYKGRNRDTAWFSIIDSDWPRIRAAFEAWLAPDNFNADFNQKSPLAARA